MIAPKPKTNERPRIPDAKSLEIVQKANKEAKKAKKSTKKVEKSKKQQQPKGQVVTRSKTKATMGSVNVIDAKEPKNYREAKNSNEWAQWKDAMLKEIEALSGQGYWLYNKAVKNRLEASEKRG